MTAKLQTRTAQPVPRVRTHSRASARVRSRAQSRMQGVGVSVRSRITHGGKLAPSLLDAPDARVLVLDFACEFICFGDGEANVSEAARSVLFNFIVVVVVVILFLRLPVSFIRSSPLHVT